MKQIERFYLGVEGGATKSTAILADAHERILATRQGKPLNYNNIGEQAVKQNLRALIAPLLTKSKGRMMSAAFGLAGNNVPKDEQIYVRIVRSLLPRGANITVVNDAKVALEARCKGFSRRILVIAGTGANVYGESNAKVARAIGWSYILGDEGSGYAVGLRILKAVTKDEDGRGKHTLLTKLVFEHTGTKTFAELLPYIYKKARNENYVGFIASFAQLLGQALIKNDAVALTIREQTAEELAEGTRAVMERLDMKHKEVGIGFMGSLWKMPGLKEIFEKKVRLLNKQVVFSNNTDEGSWGAVLLARKLS